MKPSLEIWANKNKVHSLLLIYNIWLYSFSYILYRSHIIKWIKDWLMLSTPKVFHSPAEEPLPSSTLWKPMLFYVRHVGATTWRSSLTTKLDHLLTKYTSNHTEIKKQISRTTTISIYHNIVIIQGKKKTSLCRRKQEMLQSARI